MHHAINYIKNMNLPGIAFGNSETTSFVDEIMSLGMVLESTLSWRSQINKITKNVNKALFGVQFLRACTTQALNKQLLETFVIPQLTYCSVV